MNLKGVFTIIAKAIGLFMIPKIFDIAGSVMQATQIFNGVVSGDSFYYGSLFFGYSLIFLVLYIFTIRLLLIKTHVLVDRIIYEQDLKNDFQTMQIHRSTLLSIVIICIAGVILLEEIPNLVRQIYLFKASNGDFLSSTPGNYQFVVLALSKIILALFMLYGCRPIVNWIEKQRRR
ncbi:MAG: hypothetical protein ACJ77K_10295 [Bacteroidia bacterium]